jgi:hypothetical protein
MIQQASDRQMDCRGLLEEEDLLYERFLAPPNGEGIGKVGRERIVMICDGADERLFHHRNPRRNRGAHDPGEPNMLTKSSLFEQSQLVPDTTEGQVGQSETRNADAKQEENGDLPAPKQR